MKGPVLGLKVWKELSLSAGCVFISGELVENRSLPVTCGGRPFKEDFTRRLTQAAVFVFLNK